MEHGARDNGAPGPRPEYHPGYYAAFVIDPNGYRLEAVLHNYDQKLNHLKMIKCDNEVEWNAANRFRKRYFFDQQGMEDPYTWTFDHPDHAHFLLYQGAEIVGYAHIQLWPDGRAAMRIIVIEEHMRNKHLGSSFLTLIEEWLNAMGFKSIHAESRKSSLKFYLKNGYTEMPFNDPEGYASDPDDVAVGKTL